MKCFSALRCFWLYLFLIVVKLNAYGQNVAIGVPQNNYELLVLVSNQLIEKAVTRAGLPQEKAKILLISDSEKRDSGARFLEKRLVSSFISSGYEVFQNSDTLKNLSHKGYLVEFKTIDIGVNYRQDFSKDQKLKRTCFLEVDFKIIESQSNKILLSDILSEQVTDSVDLMKIEDLEDKNMEFTVGHIDGDAQRVKIKPFIITAVTGTIVYLFYSLRSR